MHTLSRDIPLNSFIQIVAGPYTVYAITKDDNILYGWGRNDECQLGINSTNDELTPVKIGV